MRCPACGAALGPPVLEGTDRLLGVPGEFAVAECAGCRLAVTIPRLGGARLAAHYPGDYEPYRRHGISVAARLLARVRDVHMARRLRRPALARVLATGPGRVLDVGCGRGDLARAFARRGWQASGLDPSASAVEAAAEGGVDAHVGTLQDAPWATESFDAVLFHHSLEHVPDPLEALRCAGALLRPGGLLLVSAPNWASWQRRRFGSRWFHLDLPRHLQHFEPHSLAETTRRAGLRPARAWAVTSTVGLPGSVQYSLFGRCVAGGALTLPGQLFTILVRPVTLAVGRRRGGDCLDLLAGRPAPPA